MINRIIKTECGSFIDLKQIAVIKSLRNNDKTYEAILVSGATLDFIDRRTEYDRQGILLSHKILISHWTEFILSTSIGVEIN